jgi:UDP-N-acetyl-D-mannosaminuronate dehydrogenase
MPAAGADHSGFNAARRRAWAAAAARHGTLPGIRIADKTPEQVTCIRLDASVVTAHWTTRNWPSRTSRALATTRCWPTATTPVLLAGVTYKKDSADLRETPAVPVARKLLRGCARLSYANPYVREWQVEGI